jgi:hypothetical protein
MIEVIRPYQGDQPARCHKIYPESGERDKIVPLQ